MDPARHHADCISQCSCEGGANKLVDGFAVGEQLRREHPEAFELLATVQAQGTVALREPHLVPLQRGPTDSHAMSADPTRAPGPCHELTRRRALAQMEYKDYHSETLWDSGPGGNNESDGAALGGRPNDTPRMGSRG